MTTNTDAKQLSLLLTAPFPADAVHWKPLAVKGNRAPAAAYLDARAVMQRLDSVFGVGGWKDRYVITEGGSVVCTLSVKIDYLYRLPRQWCEYDPQARQFVKPLQLPAWALPATKRSA